MKRISSIFLLLWAFLSLSATTREVKLKLIETSDIHGNFFPYNFITQQDWNGSFARVYTYVQQERQTYGDNLLLMDNGDILQGQPSAYYYDRWIKQCNFPVLGANIIRTSDGQPYLKPYEIIERDGIKIAVLGMITPAIPTWLPETLWKGLSFADMEQTARKWIPIIQEKEKPDVVIGLFHAGKEARTVAGKYREDASAEIAERIPGFGGKIANAQGDSVLLINPANNGRTVGDIEICLTVDGDKVVRKSIQGTLTDMDKLQPSQEFMAQFTPQYQAVKTFVSEKVGTFTETISTRPAYFGPSAFIDFIHSLQLDLTGADISFAAPLSFDAEIKEGDIRISDMFNLYKYENMLYTMELTGKEIKGFLEESYAIWTNQMQSADDHLLLLTERKDGNGYTFTNPSFNFDSAAGIIYTVDVTKPAGQKITIQSLANGEPFDLNKTYRVALNSYRGNGGGELLTKGAGIPQDQLKDRIVNATEKDLRYYMIQYIKDKKTLSPQPLNQWKMIPEAWTQKATERDAKLLFE